MRILFVLLMLLPACAQTKEQSYVMSCSREYPPLPGQLSPGTEMVFDVSTSSIPFISEPHRQCVYADQACHLEACPGMEAPISSPISGIISSASSPLSTIAKDPAASVAAAAGLGL